MINGPKWFFHGMENMYYLQCECWSGYIYFIFYFISFSSFFFLSLSLGHLYKLEVSVWVWAVKQPGTSQPANQPPSTTLTTIRFHFTIIFIFKNIILCIVVVGSPWTMRSHLYFFFFNTAKSNMEHKNWVTVMNVAMAGGSTTFIMKQQSKRERKKTTIVWYKLVLPRFDNRFHLWNG